MKNYRIYFETTNGGSLVIVTDDETAKIFRYIFFGVDLRINAEEHEATAQKLRKIIEETPVEEMPDYNDYFSVCEKTYERVKTEIEAGLEDGSVIRVY